MSKPRIYLAGPVTGLSYEDATQWRVEAVRRLPEIRCFSPMRAKQAQQGRQCLGWEANDLHDADAIFTPKGIVARDYLDCRKADLLLVNFEPSAPEISIGTVSEISWAWADRTPTIVIATPGNRHDCKWLRELVPFWTDNFDDAIRLVQTILLPGD